MSIDIKEYEACGEYVVVEPCEVSFKSGKVLVAGASSLDTVYGRVMSVGDLAHDDTGVERGDIVAFLQSNGKQLSFSPLKRIAIKGESVIAKVG